MKSSLCLVRNISWLWVQPSQSQG